MSYSRNATPVAMARIAAVAPRYCVCGACPTRAPRGSVEFQQRIMFLLIPQAGPNCTSSAGDLRRRKPVPSSCLLPLVFGTLLALAAPAVLAVALAASQDWSITLAISSNNDTTSSGGHRSTQLQCFCGWRIGHGPSYQLILASVSDSISAAISHEAR